MQSIEIQVLNRIYGGGRGWAFSQKDFASIGDRNSIDKALSLLRKKEKIRRVIRGIYDYPKYSEKLKMDLSPDVDQVAQAIARRHGWRIQPTGPAALNIVGLSTQVPSKFTYLTDSANNKYIVGNTILLFKKEPLKEIAFKYHESSIIVQTIKSLRANNITPTVIDTLAKWLGDNMPSKILKDTKTVSSWIYDIILKICKELSNG
ncbi:MAG: hypothetical protein J7J98_04365 [candidate division Zixibacteria bacterium]|nr:hypothetical protein [candidate division Zixibacteria bacterium]